MSVSILGAVLNAHDMAPRLPVAFGVLAVGVVLAIAVSSLSLSGGPAGRARLPLRPNGRARGN
ncbi:MAG: hypothetical protein JO372_14545 [Solirubrobacterales bacterium]|nr:hypothetical protein [Solirubrobacterales bacterium]